MKTSVINIRLNQDIKEELETLSKTEGKSISVIVREAINKFLKELISNKNENLELNEDEYLLQTLGFAELIFWIYDKRYNQELNEIDELYLEFIALIEAINKNPLFTEEIVFEFNKISNELKYYLNNKEHFKSTYEFPVSEKNLFDYDKFSHFMFSIRYDENNNKVIHIK
tara:strand:- start:6502 stop:7011 length:510 start_codon:yes stop_codon:yes gene_type:complete